ncbi:hypothetical protein D3C81_2220080 [compost metagenome]
MRVRMKSITYVAQRDVSDQYIRRAETVQAPGCPSVATRLSKLPSATRNHGTSLSRNAVMLSYSFLNIGSLALISL